MTEYEGMATFLSIGALAVSFWNARRLSSIDERSEYKSRSEISCGVKDALVDLISDIEKRCAAIRMALFEIPSLSAEYANSLGYSSGSGAVQKALADSELKKAQLEQLVIEVKSLKGKPDKEVFDRCVEIRSESKEISLLVTKSILSAEQHIADMKAVIIESSDCH